MPSKKKVHVFSMFTCHRFVTIGLWSTGEAATRQHDYLSCALYPNRLEALSPQMQGAVFVLKLLKFENKLPVITAVFSFTSLYIFADARSSTEGRFM